MRNIADKVSDRKIKEDFGIDMQRTLHLIRGHDLVGTMIAEAVKRGEFDNLEGFGKPLNLDENPYEPAEMHMAYKILKDNGFAPYWIELGKEIDASWVKFDKEVDYFKKYTRIILGEKPSTATKNRYELRKNDFYAQSRERLVEISMKILDYNLHCPVSQLGRANFDVNEKMSSIIEDIEKSLQD
jgi:DnaJ homolog subfamily C member 28